MQKAIFFLLFFVSFQSISQNINDFEFDDKLKVIYPFTLSKEETNAFTWDKTSFDFGYASVKIDDVWILIDSLGNVVPGFTSVKYPVRCYGDIFRVSTHEGMGLVSSSNEEILPSIYDFIFYSEHGFKGTINSKETVLLDKTGKDILKRGVYKDVNISSSFLIYKEDDKIEIQFLNGNNSLPEGYKFKEQYGEYLLGAIKKGKEYLFDPKGQLLSEIPIEWARVVGYRVLKKNFYQIKFENKEYTCYKVDSDGFELKLQEDGMGIITNIDAPFYVYMKDGKLGVVDEVFDPILEPDSFKYILCRNPGCIVQNKDGTFSIINQAKRLIHLPEFGKVTVWPEGFSYWDSESNSRVFLNDNGKPFLEKKEQQSYRPIKGLKDIFIDETGERNWLVSIEGKVISEKSYDLINQYDVFGDYIKVRNGNDYNERKYGLIHKSGKEIIEPQFDEIIGDGDSNGEFFIVVNNKLKGVVNNFGHLIIPTEFDKIKVDEYGFIWVEKDGKTALLKNKN